MGFKTLEVPEQVRNDWEKKTCTRCAEVKTRGDFHKDKRVADGLRYECKECHKKAKDDAAFRKYTHLIQH